VKKRSLLDSYALLAYLKAEEGHQKVAELLNKARETEVFLLMNEINLGEVFYIIAKERSLREAEQFWQLFPTLPIELIPNSCSDVLEAARLKAQYPLAYADCFVLSTALKKGATLITGDIDFRKVAHLVKIEWI